MEDVEMDGEAWLEHQYLYTYRIADRVQELAENHTAHSGDLESLTADFGIAEFIRPWQPDSALHKFIRYAADDLMESDNSGTVKMPFWDRSRNLRWTVPIELALTSYGLQDDIRFTLANIPQIYETIGNTTYARDAPEVSDACFDHFQSVRLTQPYMDFLRQVSEEVFFVMFTNRGTLQKLHEYLAYYVTENDYAYVFAEHPALAGFYTKSGRLQRRNPPKWARRAVFFRDRGMCTACRRDISGLLDPLGAENYDHIVPLAVGGLNDVTNLQLLCRTCNSKKSDRREAPSKSYRRWY
ncbi:hypothetical protein GCM10010267_22580 [Streptomyces griseorubens]|uniref:HNH endonuclease n=1 Tax=Streptomyces griseorubens TaxID=66897 RepID=UPI00177DFC11|nr:hypothetical protein GCM10010267_22580 [Streptomyces griseorubens]